MRLPCVGAVELVGTASTDRFLIILSGSDNLRDWHELSRSSSGRLSGIWRHPCRYYRISASGRLSASGHLEGLIFKLRN